MPEKHLFVEVVWCHAIKSISQFLLGCRCHSVSIEFRRFHTQYGRRLHIVEDILECRAHDLQANVMIPLLFNPSDFPAIQETEEGKGLAP